MKTLACGLLVASALAFGFGCRPAYEATPEGTTLEKWTAPTPVKELGQPFTQEVQSSQGTKYRVTARSGAIDDRRVVGEVRVELVQNPARAKISVHCREPMHYVSDPEGVFSTPCIASELVGERSPFKTETRQLRVTVRVIADGRVLVE